MAVVFHLERAHLLWRPLLNEDAAFSFRVRREHGRRGDRIEEGADAWDPNLDLVPGDELEAFLGEGRVRAIRTKSGREIEGGRAMQCWLPQ